MLLTIRYPKFATLYTSAIGLLICFAEHTWAQDPTPTPAPVDLNIVAHQDDDILFMNPDILNKVVEGHRQVTVYITAGNTQIGEQAYAMEREEGAIAGYSKLLQIADAKIADSGHFDNLSGTFQGDSRNPLGCASGHCFQCEEHACELSTPGTARGQRAQMKIGSRTLNVATIGDGPGGPRVTLIFLRVNSPLPVNLAQLFTSPNTKLQIGSPFTQPGYTKQQLITQLVQILQVFQPDIVRTQDTADGHIVDPVFKTTIGSASNGQTLPQSTINVASTAGFPPSAIVDINVGGVDNFVLYTGLTSTALTGCISYPGNSSTMATGNVVIASSGEQVTDQGCAPPFPGSNSYDHTDHVWGARFAREALRRYDAIYNVKIPSTYSVYMGYNLEWNEPTDPGIRLTSSDFCVKKSIFRRYALYDYYVIAAFCTDPNFNPNGAKKLVCGDEDLYAPFDCFFYWYMGYQQSASPPLP